MLHTRMERKPDDSKEERLAYLNTKYEDSPIDWMAAATILGNSGTSVGNMPKTIKDFIETEVGSAWDKKLAGVSSELAAASYKVAIASIVPVFIFALSFQFSNPVLFFSSTHFRKLSPIWTRKWMSSRTSSASSLRKSR